MLEILERFCEKVSDIDEVQEILENFEHIYQFKLNNGETYLLKFEDGTVKAEKNKVPYDVYKVFDIDTDIETMKELFGGRLRLSEAIYTSKLSSNNMSKRPYVSYLGRTIRLHHES